MRIRIWAPFALCFFSLGCGDQSPPNVLLISIDTLRADHLGCYGYERDTTPALDKLASESILFTQAFAPAPRTFPSHVMMFTGMHPHRLGTTRDGDQSSIPRQAPMLPELLQQAGYQTVGFVDSARSGWLAVKRGFARGFDAYHLAPHARERFDIYDVAATTKAASAWLETRDPERPFFMFFHTKSAHTVRGDLPRPDNRIFPYEAPEPYRTRFLPKGKASRFTWNVPRVGAGTLYLTALNKAFYAGKKDPAEFPKKRLEVLKALYDGAISYTDAHVGRFLEKLDELELLDETIVILVSDHGEAFLEHGFFVHGNTVYREMLHVPLMIRLPRGRDKQVRSEPVSIGDIPPTVLDILEMPIPAEMEGWPLLRPDIKTRGERPFFAFIRDRITSAIGLSIRSGDWKLVYDRLRADEGFRARLYNLKEDPGELHPIEGEVERAGLMLKELMAWRDGKEFAVGEDVELDEETLEHLRAVGYIN